MSDTEKIETKAVLGQAHPAQCWGWWDEKARECKECLVAEKCEETTRRLSGKASLESAIKPKSVSSPVKKAPEEEKRDEVDVDVRPMADEKSSEQVEKASEEEQKEEKANKEEQKEEKASEEEQKEEKRQDDGEAITSAVLARIPGGSVVEKKLNKGIVYSFLGSDGNPVLQIGILWEGGKMKLQSPKSKELFRVMDVKFSEEEMTASLDALL